MTMAKCDVLAIAQNLSDELIDVRRPMAAFFLRVFAGRRGGDWNHAEEK